ncbi:polyprenyl synthetase family protein [Xylanimonas protaetiae]|uniref:Polyprenyl synthetase family protein n=1 Tax=Xylanimonas protaetiae TaxID=2509457 RepID=A0A4V0YGN1_9MICO|nr:polyprenyl synthetase family protein [Xylanimonas protaetiae]QAY71791.1 polyprenyl synthetase family protein [Xylanimonas protaetiae]
MAAVEAALADAVAIADPLADDVARHLVAAGGKRLRPFLTLLTGELGDGARPELVDAAIVVELTHLASLYHDDVMDSAPLRRGAPSVHSVWGNSVAILVGDLLFARASSRVASLGPEAVLLQSATFERLCLGQLHETTGPAGDEDAVAHYLQVLADKTASLLATSARFGAWFGGAPDEQVEIVAGYGEKVGIAFQLADDVLDLASTGDESGKTPGTDLREKVPTMPVLLLRRRVARGEASAADAALLAALDGDLTSDETLADVVGRLRAHDVLTETRELAARYAREAAAELAPLPEGPVREALEAFATALAHRAA